MFGANISPSIKDDEIKTKFLFEYSENNWRYNCHSITAEEKHNMNYSVDSIVKYTNDIYYNHIECLIYLDNTNNDNFNFFLNKSPYIYFRDKEYLLKAGNMKLFININPDISHLTLFSSMYSEKNIYIYPQYQILEYNNNLINQKKYCCSEYVFDQKIDLFGKSEIIDFIEKDISYYQTTNQKAQYTIDSFLSSLKSFPDVFKNLEYDSKITSGSNSNKLIFTKFMEKIEEFYKNFLKNLNINLLQIIKKLNINSSLTEANFKDVLEFKVIFSNSFSDIFEKDKEIKQYDDLSYSLTNVNEEYILNIAKPNLFIHNFVSFGIYLKENFLENYSKKFPLYQSLNQNLFNSFNKEDVYHLHEYNQDNEIISNFQLLIGEAFSNCFWINFKNLDKLEDNFVIFTDNLTFRDENNNLIGNELEFKFEISLPTDENLNDINNSIMIFKISYILLNYKIIEKSNIRTIYKKGYWNHICLFLYPLDNNFSGVSTLIRNSFNYEIFINDKKTTLNFDLLDIGQSLTYSYFNLQNPYLTNMRMNNIIFDRSLSNPSHSLLFNDYKMYKIAPIILNLDLSVTSDNILTINNLFHTMKYIKAPNLSNDYSLISGNIYNQAFDEFYSNLSHITLKNDQGIKNIENLKKINFLNSAENKNYDSIFQIGFPKLIILENYINIKIMFEGDFIIKSFQKAFFKEKINPNVLDFDDQYVEFKIFDIERKSVFAYSLDFFSLQKKIDVYFPISYITTLTNRNNYYFTISLQIKNTFDYQNLVTKDNYEFKLIVKYIMFNKSNLFPWHKSFLCWRCFQDFMVYQFIKRHHRVCQNYMIKNLWKRIHRSL